MATSTLLSNPKVQIGAAIGSIVDLTDQTTAATLTRTVEALEDTAFGTGSRTYTGGLENNELTVTESTASTAPPPAVTAPASTTTITTVPFINNTPVESNGTAVLPAILEPHPINVGDMPAPTHDTIR